MSDETKLPPLERYIKILELLAAFPDGLSLKDIAAMLALPKASAHRLVATMEKSNLIVFSNGPAQAIVLSSRMRRLIFLAADGSVVDMMTRDMLKQLSQDTEETCYIAKLEGNKVRSIVMESPNAPWRGFVVPGKIMHSHAAACAKAILAFQPDEVVDQVLEGDLPRLTAHTKTDRKAIEQELGKVRQAGFATCLAEVDDGLAAIAVPIHLTQVGVIYSLGIVGPYQRIIKLIEGDVQSRLTPLAQSIAAILTKTKGAISEQLVPSVL